MALIKMRQLSKVMGMEMPINIMLPKNDAAYEKPLPVLWLLHGLSEDASTWMRHTRVERYLRDYGIAAVLVNAHQSCYEDMAHGGRFFTYITEELPQMMRRCFPLSWEREDNYVAGLSMGGMGAIKVGLAYPERYSVIGCFSAGHANYRAAVPSKMEYHQKVFDNAYGGGMALTEARTEAQARRIVSEALPAPRIYHTCGTNDFIRKNARQTRDFFESFNGNPFDYIYEEMPGIHNWDYWDRQVQHFLIYIEKGSGGLRNDCLHRRDY